MWEEGLTFQIKSLTTPSKLLCNRGEAAKCAQFRGREEKQKAAREQQAGRTPAGQGKCAARQQIYGITSKPGF